MVGLTPASIILFILGKMSYHYDDEDEFDIRVRRGRVSPVTYYPDHHEQPVARSVYYQHGSSYLVPESSGRLHRSRSRGRPSPPPNPVIINNRIYNDFESQEEDDRYLQLSPPIRTRSRSRSHAREDYELERTRKELELYRLDAQREEDEKRMKKELELQRLREEKRAEEEKKRIKKEADGKSYSTPSEFAVMLMGL